MFQQTKIDELLSQLNQDKAYIEERQQIRQERYKKSTNNFQKSVQREMETIQKTKDQHNERNQQFYNQIKDVYTRYQSSSLSLINTFRKTSKSKIKFNDDILNFYPASLRDQRTQLEDNIDTLKTRLKTLQNINKKENYDYYAILQKKYEGYSNQEEIRKERERLELEIQKTKEYMRPQSQGNVRFLENFDNKYVKGNKKQPVQEQDEVPPAPQYVQQQRITSQEVDITNLEQYAGLKPSGTMALHREQAQKILDDFTLPIRQKIKPIPNKTDQRWYTDYQNPTTLQQYQQQPQYYIPPEQYEINQDYRQQRVQEGGFVHSRQMSQQTFHESTDKQSSDQQSGNKEDNIPSVRPITLRKQEVA